MTYLVNFERCAKNVNNDYRSKSIKTFIKFSFILKNFKVKICRGKNIPNAKLKLHPPPPPLQKTLLTFYFLYFLKKHLS